MILFVKISCFVIVAITFLAVWRIESKWRIILTPFMMLMYFELVRILPAFFVADAYGVSRDLVPLMIAVFAYLSLVTGFVCGYFYRPTSPDRVLLFSELKIPDLRVKRKESFAVLVLVLLLIVLGLYYYQGLPATVDSLFGLFTGGSEDLIGVVGQNRFLLTKGAYFGEQYRGQGIIRVILRVGWSLVCCYTLMVALQHKNLISRLIFFFTILLTWTFVAGTGEREPFLYILLIVVGAFSFRKALSFRFTIFTIVGLIFIAVFLSMYSGKIYSLFAGNDSFIPFIKQAIHRIIDRILFGNAMYDVKLIDLINSGEWKIRWGANHLLSFINAIPGVQYGVPFGQELYLYLNPKSIRTISASGTYLQNVYVDFSWYGVFPIYFMAGAFVGLIQRWLLSVKPTPWKLSCVVVIFFNTVNVISSGFVGVIASFVIIAVLIGMHSIFIIFIRAMMISMGHPNRPIPQTTQHFENHQHHKSRGNQPWR